MEKDFVELIDAQFNVFSIYSREKLASRILGDMRRRKVAVYCMPQIQRRCLGTLYYMPAGQWISAKTLAISAQVYKGDASRAMHTLEEAGYIQTRVDPNDRRSRQAIITQAGAEVCRDGNQQFIDLMRAYFHKFLSQGEMEDFYTCFEKVNGYLQKLEPEKFFVEECAAQA